MGVGWAAQAVSALRAHTPPNLGVVGPVCNEGNTRILTHDLVHRTHLQVPTARGCNPGLALASTPLPSPTSRAPVWYFPPADFLPSHLLTPCRLHLQIFEHYYPPIFSDWWMDDWITHGVCSPTSLLPLATLTSYLSLVTAEPRLSLLTSDFSVYGPSRTRRGPFRVVHRIGHQGTRYEVDQTHEGWLQSELQLSRARVERYLLEHAGAGSAS